MTWFVTSLRFLYVVVQSKKVTGFASKIGPPKRGAIVNMCKRLHDQCVLYRSNDESIERRTTVSTSKKEGVRVSFSFGWRLSQSDIFDGYLIKVERIYISEPPTAQAKYEFGDVFYGNKRFER